MPNANMPPLAQVQLLIACLRSSAYTESKVDDDKDTVTISLGAINREIVIRRVDQPPPKWSDLTQVQQSFYMTEGLAMLDRFGLAHEADTPTVDGRLHEALVPWGWVPSDDLIVAGLKSYEDLERKND